MTFEEFEKKFKKNTRFDKYWYHGLCYATIGFAIFMLFALLTNSIIRFSGNKLFHSSMFSFLILLGTYGLFVLRSKYKLTVWENNLSMDRNINLMHLVIEQLNKSRVSQATNYIHFTYKKSWWRLPYEVHLFADNNFIAINVEAQDNYDGGFIDFGASKRTQNRILDMLIEEASR